MQVAKIYIVNEPRPRRGTENARLENTGKGMYGKPNCVGLLHMQ